MLVAYRELEREAKKADMTMQEYIVDGPDPINVGVFLEDSIAVAGVGTAALCIGELSIYFFGWLPGCLGQSVSQQVT